MTRVAMLVLAVVVPSATIAFVVWFVGFDVPWALAAVILVLPVGRVIATSTFPDPEPWPPPAGPRPRGPRLTVSVLVQALAACDRLARPTLIRRLGALLFPEREDLLARAALVRELRALPGADWRDTLSDDVTLTTAALAQRLDALERQPTETS